MDDINENLFSKIQYFVCGNLDENIEELLRKGGAQHRSYISDLVTHLICGKNYSEDELSLTIDIYSVIPVTENWVQQSVRLKRLASTNPYNPLKSNIFLNLNAIVINLSNDDKKKLYSFITYYGGIVTSNFTNCTTHLICGVATGRVYEKALTLPNIIIVTPDWIVNCIKHKQLINIDSYHPRLLKIDPAKFLQINPTKINNNTNLNSLSNIIGTEDVFENIQDNRTEFSGITNFSQELHEEDKNIQPNLVTQQNLMDSISVTNSNTTAISNNPSNQLIRNITNAGQSGIVISTLSQSSLNNVIPHQQQQQPQLMQHPQQQQQQVVFVRPKTIQHGIVNPGAPSNNPCGQQPTQIILQKYIQQSSNQSIQQSQIQQQQQPQQQPQIQQQQQHIQQLHHLNIQKQQNQIQSNQNNNQQVSMVSSHQQIQQQISQGQQMAQQMQLQRQQHSPHTGPPQSPLLPSTSPQLLPPSPQLLPPSPQLPPPSPHTPSTPQPQQQLQSQQQQSPQHHPVAMSPQPNIVVQQHQGTPQQSPVPGVTTMSPQAQRLMQQQQHLQQQQQLLNQNAAQMTPQQQQLFQGQINRQQQALMQARQQYQLQQQLQMQQMQQQQQQQQQLQQSPRIHQNHSPRQQQNQTPSPQSAHHSNIPPSPLQPQHQLNPSPSPQMTPPPPPSPQAGISSVQQHLRQQLQLNRHQQQNIIVGSPQQQQIQIKSGVPQAISPSGCSTPTQQQQQLLFNPQQQQKLQQSQLQPQTISKQILLTKPIDPTDPQQVAHILNRTTPSPQQQHLDQNSLIHQQLTQQLKIQQQQQSQQQTLTPQNQQIVHQQQQSPQQQQQIIISQGGNQIIAQRHIINTSTTQGQQIIQSHMLNMKQQQLLQQQQQQIQQKVTNSPQFQFNQGNNNQQNVNSGNMSSAQQVRIIQGQQVITQQVSQNIQQQQQQAIQAGGSPGAQANQGFQQIITQKPTNIQQQQQQQQQQANVGSQTTNKQYQTKILFTQQQFNQLTPQQQQQILQNQQNQNIIIINQTNQNLIQQQQQQSQSQQQTPIPQQQLAQHQQAPSNLSQMLKNFTQKQQQMQQQQINQQNPSNQMDTDQNLNQPQQSPQIQQQQSPQIQQQQPQVISQQRLQYLQQQQQLQLHMQNKQIVATATGQQQIITTTGGAQQQQQIIAAGGSQQQIIIQQQQHPISEQSPQKNLHQIVQNQIGMNSPQKVQVQNQVVIQQHQQQQITATGVAASNEQILLQQATNQQQILNQQTTSSLNQQTSQTVLVQQHQQSSLQQSSIIPQNQQQIIIQQQQQSVLPAQQQWVTQSTPIRGPIPQGQVPNAQPTQFIRAIRPGQWQTQPGVAAPQRQLIQLDDKAHAQFMAMDSLKKAEYITKLQNKQRLMRQQAAYQVRPGTPGTAAVVARPGPGGTQHIIVQSQMPPGLNQQQQMQWLQQQGARQVLVRSTSIGNATPGLSPLSQQQQQNVIQQQQIQNQQTLPIDTNAGPQQQQQMLLQRQQQSRFQQLQLQNQKISLEEQQSPQQQQQQQQLAQQSPNTIIAQSSTVNLSGSQNNNIALQAAENSQNTIVSSTNIVGSNVNQQQQQIMTSKTKTALANMLNSRMTSVIPQQQQQQQVPQSEIINTSGVVNPNQSMSNEPSAAGTLRLMTAQHNAALSQGVPRTPQEILILQQQQQQAQQLQHRRALVTNNGQILASSSQPVSQIQTGQPLVIPPQSPGGTVAIVKSSTSPFNPCVRSQIVPPRPQFYGHNPNLKLHPDSFLLGCTFFIVEYDEDNEYDVENWIELIQEAGGELEKNYCQKVTHVLCRSQRHGVVMQAIRDSKRCVTVYWLNDVFLKKQVFPPWQALHLPFPSTFVGNQKPAKNHLIGISGFEGDERKRIKSMAIESGGSFTTTFSKTNTILVCRKPEGEKYKKAKEWNKPVVNTAWLSDIVLGNLSLMTQFDNPKYQQYNLNGPFRIDYSLVLHLMAAWKSPINLTQESHEKLKRSLSDPSSTESKTKRLKSEDVVMESVPENIICIEYPEQMKQPKILFTQVYNVSGLQKAVNALGGIVVDSPSEATHLIMTVLGNRTMKYLQAISYVHHVCSSSWIIDSANAGKFLSENNYQMCDNELEKSFDFSLKHILESPIRRTLFKNKIFYVTPSVEPKKHNIEFLIKSAGGIVEDKRRSGAGITEANAQSQDNYVVVTVIEDLHFLCDLVRPGRPKCLLILTEGIMSSILKQTICFNDHIIPFFSINGFTNNNITKNKK